MQANKIYVMTKNEEIDKLEGDSATDTAGKEGKQQNEEIVRSS